MYFKILNKDHWVQITCNCAISPLIYHTYITTVWPKIVNLKPRHWSLKYLYNIGFGHQLAENKAIKMCVTENKLFQSPKSFFFPRWNYFNHIFFFALSLVYCRILPQSSINYGHKEIPLFVKHLWNDDISFLEGIFFNIFLRDSSSQLKLKNKQFNRKGQ